MQGGTTFTFVTEGIEAALEQARAAAGGRDVAIGGGANVAQQYLRAGLLDELHIHLIPLLLGDGVRLFGDGLVKPTGELECAGVTGSPSGATHLTYRVVRATS
jgi:dihydrofolate reductase